MATYHWWIMCSLNTILFIFGFIKQPRLMTVKIHPYERPAVGCWWSLSQSREPLEGEVTGIAPMRSTDQGQLRPEPGAMQLEDLLLQSSKVTLQFGPLLWLIGDLMKRLKSFWWFYGTSWDFHWSSSWFSWDLSGFDGDLVKFLCH